MIFKRKNIIIALWVILLPVPTMALNHYVPIKTLTLKDAIFLALRYNPNIQNLELGRITQKFNIREAENVFELQYALEGSLLISRSKSGGGRDVRTKTYNLTPSMS